MYSHGQFDYMRAWREVALPSVLVLPQNFRDLYWKVVDRCSRLSQQKDLDMPWPEPGFRRPLQNLFQEVPSECLADAARAIYFWGHWSPFNQSAMGAGASWKFTNYADQVLRDKIQLPRSFAGRGVGFQVNEGYLRMCYSTRNCWTWTEFGRATVATYERARRIVEEEEVGKSTMLDNGALYELSCRLVKELCPDTFFGRYTKKMFEERGW